MENENSNALFNENLNDREKYDSIPRGFEGKKHRTPKQIEEIWINMRNIPENSKCVYTLLVIAAISAIALCVMGVALHLKNDCTISRLVIGFSCLALATFFWGLYAVYSYNKKAEDFLQNQGTVNPEDIDQSLERNFLNIFMFLIMLLFIIFGLIAVGSFTNREEILFEIKALAVNEDTWKKAFGDLTYGYVNSKFDSIMIAVGVVSLIYTLFLGVIIYYIFDMLGFYRAVQTVVQFITLLYFTLALILLYFSIYTVRYSEITNVEQAVPMWLPAFLLALSVFAMIVSISGFIGAYLEKKDILNIFMWITIVFSVIIVVCTVLFFVFSDNFESLFQNNCYSLMDLVQESHLKDSIGCSRKYMFNSNTLDNLICPKERVASNWEVNLGVPQEEQKTIYGCLDKACCYTFYSYLKNNIDYLAVTALILFISSIFMTIGAYIMIGRLESGDEIGSSSKDTLIGIISFTLIVIICFIVLICNVPSAPEPNPATAIMIDETPINNTVIPKDQINNDNGFNNSTEKDQVLEDNEEENKKKIGKDTVIVENKAGCTANSPCFNLRYTYNITSYDGKVKANDKLTKNDNITIVKEQNDYDNSEDKLSYLIFSSEYAIPHFIDLIDFDIPCELNPSKLTIKVTGLPYNNTSTETDTKASSFIKSKLNNKNHNSKSKLKLRNKVNEATTNSSDSVEINNANDDSSTSSDSGSSSNETQTATSSNTQDYNTNDEDDEDIASVIQVNFRNLEEGKEITIIDDLIVDFSYVQNKTININGKVVDEDGNFISNANVTFTPSDFSKCGSYDVVSSTVDGTFGLNNIYLFKNDLSVKYDIKISKEGYYNFESKTYTGGYAAGDINLSDSILFLKNTKTEENNDNANTEENNNSTSTNNTDTTNDSTATNETNTNTTTNENTTDNTTTNDTTTDNTATNNTTTDNTSTNETSNSTDNTATNETSTNTTATNETTTDNTATNETNTTTSNETSTDNTTNNTTDNAGTNNTTTDNTSTNETSTNNTDTTNNNAGNTNSTDNTKPIEENKNIKVFAKVVDAQNNSKLSNVNIKVYKGYKELSQKIITEEAQEQYNNQNSNGSGSSSGSLDFLKLKSKTKSEISKSILSLLKDSYSTKDTSSTTSDNDYILETSTNENGEFNFELYTPGEYTIVYSKDKYHRGILSKLLILIYILY